MIYSWPTSPSPVPSSPLALYHFGVARQGSDNAISHSTANHDTDNGHGLPGGGLGGRNLGVAKKRQTPQEAEMYKEQLFDHEEDLKKKVLPELRGFNFKIARLIKKLRKKRMYFFDTMLMKSSKYTRTMVQEGKQLRGGLLTAVQELEKLMAMEKGDKTGSWRLRYALKRIRKECLVEKSKAFEQKAAKKVDQMDKVLDDLVQYYTL